MSEIKKILTSVWGIAFFLTITSCFYDVVLFRHNGPFFNSFGYFCVFSIYLLAWVGSLWCGRGLTIFFLFFNFVLFCVFKEYYKFHIVPIQLSSMISAWQEGVRAGVKNTASLFDIPFGIGLFILFIQAWIVSKLKLYQLKKGVGIFLVLGIMGVGLNGSFGAQKILPFFETLYPPLYLSFQQGMFYKMSFLKSSGELDKLDRLIQTGNKDRHLQSAFLNPIPSHIYLIQAESLTTIPLFHKPTAMPFLKRMIDQKKAVLFVDAQHNHCLGSANTDFMMLSGLILDCQKTTAMIYSRYRPHIYRSILTLPRRFKKRGYQTFFFHGYEGSFFNRRTHMKPMGFDHVWFEEDFDPKIQRGIWGIDDKTLLLKAADETVNQEQSFTFIITAGMHPPYELPQGTIPFIRKPQSQRDSYLNGAAFLDEGLALFYEKLPCDSLVILYGDHNSPDIGGLDTPLILIYKGNRVLDLPQKEEGFNGSIRLIQTLF